MMSYFFDTNALVKRYVYQQGSNWVNGVMGKKSLSPSIYVSELVRVEVASTLYKIERIEPHDTQETDWERNRFEKDLDVRGDYRNSRFNVIYLTPTLLSRASWLLEYYRSGQPKAIRSLDAIQLASALLARDTLQS